MTRGRVLWSTWLDGRGNPNRSRARAAPGARRKHRCDRRGPAWGPLLRPRRHHAGRGRGPRGLPRGHRDRADARRDPPPGAHQRHPPERPARQALPRRRVEAVGAEWCEPCQHIEASRTRRAQGNGAPCRPARGHRRSPAASPSATRSTKSETQPHKQVVAAGGGGPAVEADRPVERQCRGIRLVGIEVDARAAPLSRPL